MHGCQEGGMRGCSGGGMCGCSRGACMGYDEIRRYNQWAGGMHPTGMHSCYSILLLPTNEVWGKVIFLHLFVILFTGMGGLLTRGECLPKEMGCLVWSLGGLLQGVPGPGVCSGGCLVSSQGGLLLEGCLVLGGPWSWGVPGPGGCLLPGEVPGGDLPGRLLLRAARILLGCMEEEGPKIFKLVKNKLCLEFNQK